jgi:hypothetical protein
VHQDVPVYAKGIWLRVDGGIPRHLGMDSRRFVDGSVSTYLTARIPLQPTLALARADGRTSVSIRSSCGVHRRREQRRLGRQNRYGGDAAVWQRRTAPALTNFFVLPRRPRHLRAGRRPVYLEGETSDTWHTAYGGGLWLSFLQHTMFLSAAIAQTSERTGVYIGTGMAF